METDKTTLTDLVIFDKDEEFSVFSKIDFTITIRGKDQLRENLSSPLSDISAIKNVQDTILYIKDNRQNWPVSISNGTLMVVERFYDTSIDPIPVNPAKISAWAY